MAGQLQKSRQIMESTSGIAHRLAYGYDPKMTARLQMHPEEGSTTQAPNAAKSDKCHDKRYVAIFTWGCNCFQSLQNNFQSVPCGLWILGATIGRSMLQRYKHTGNAGQKFKARTPMFSQIDLGEQSY